MTSSTLQDPRWQAVLARSTGEDGKFFYAVRTTGVYCRPSCPSRRARAENVSFHVSCADAERAGFRACQRCKPRSASLAVVRAAMITRACRFIEDSVTAPTLATVARQAGLSAYHFHRIFKATTGLTPSAYMLAQRARRVRKALSHAQTVTEAIMDAGFNSGGRFYAKSNELLGMTPKAFRAGGVDHRIQSATRRCLLGSVLVAGTAKGICAILLGASAKALQRELRERFPMAQFHRADQVFTRAVSQVVRFVDAPGVGLALPLDVRGTVFQQRVWQALQEIPAGATASYSDIARRIGAPRAVRAVASACAANALAVAIPCHRVVRGDGTLSGYRWGVARKRALLHIESR